MAPPLAGETLGSASSSFVIAEWGDPGGPAGPPRYIAPRHLHYLDDEVWYVVQGTLRVQVGSDVVEARPGSAVFVPRGTPHTYWNPAAEPLRYLLVMTPNIFHLIQEIHAMKERTAAALREVFRRHHSELLDG